MSFDMHIVYLTLPPHIVQGRSQNLKEVPQISRKFLTLMTSELMTSYREINIAKKKIIFSSILVTDVKLGS